LGRRQELEVQSQIEPEEPSEEELWEEFDQKLRALRNNPNLPDCAREIMDAELGPADHDLI
jgi:hypothetical protein